MAICNVKRRAANWSPLSAEARALLQAEPAKWDYVELWDGAAAQSCVFGVPTRRAPDLFDTPAPEKPDRDQMSFDL